MDLKTYNEFFNALTKIVNEDNLTYKEKLDALKRQMSDHDETNLHELMSWFGFEE